MKRANDSKRIRSIDRFTSVLAGENILCLQAMISVRGRDGGDPTIPPPPPGKP